MVIARFFMVFSLFFVPAYAQAVTADDLRTLSSDGERDRQSRNSRANTNNLGPLVGSDGSDKVSVDKSQKNDKIAPKRFTKKKNKSDSVTTSDVKNSAGGTQSGKEPQAQVEAAPRDPVPGQKSVLSDAVNPSSAFGIRLGTWIEGNINRNTSSAEPGLVEITITSDVVGDKKTLKAGTLLFAQKQINGSTKRLELMAEKGITPDGKEFKITGLIFDTQKVSGLAGIISDDTDRSVRRGASKGLLAAAGAAAQTVGAGTPIGSAAGAASASVLQDQSNVVDQTTEQKLTIYVSPQPLLIRIEQSL